MSEIEHLVMPALRAAGRQTTYENQERMRKALTEAAATQKRNQRTMSEISEKEVEAAHSAANLKANNHTYVSRASIVAALEAAAHARAEAVGVKDASYTEMLIDNAATASQCDFDAATREAIRLNIIDPLLGMYGEYTPISVGTGTALAHPAVPEGMVLVPRAAVDETFAKAEAQSCDLRNDDATRRGASYAATLIRAMIAAAEKEAE